MPMLVLGYIPPHAGALPALLTTEMAVQARRAAGESVQFEVLVHDRARSSGLITAAQAMQLRVDRWHDLNVSTDDCRIACDWYAERHGVSQNLLWTQAGPTEWLRAGTALDRRTPADIATRLAVPTIWQGARLWPLHLWRGDTAPRTGRHAGQIWLNARGGVGYRLLALWTAAYDRPTEAADFASMDATIRRIARVILLTTREPTCPDATRCDQWAQALWHGQMNTVLARWLNAAERQLDAGEPVNLALLRILGLSEASQLRIIP